MGKPLEQNLNLILFSAITGLQNAYTNYKNAVIEDLSYSWYDNDGNFTILEGQEERQRKIAKLTKEVARLRFKVEEIKNEIRAKGEQE